MNARSVLAISAKRTGLFFIFVVFVFCACGQGVIVFNNRVLNPPSGAPVDAPIFRDFVGGTPIDGSDASFRAALLGGGTELAPAFVPGSRTNGPTTGQPVTGSLNLLSYPGDPTITWVNFRTGATAGYVNVGGFAPRNSGLGFGVLGTFQVVAWRGPYETWDAAFAAWQNGSDPSVLVGASNPLILETSINDEPLAYPYLVGLESFALVAPIPEPGVLALGGLGLLVSVWFSRKRKRTQVE